MLKENDIVHVTQVSEYSGDTEHRSGYVTSKCDNADHKNHGQHIHYFGGGFDRVNINDNPLITVKVFGTYSAPKLSEPTGFGAVVRAGEHHYRRVKAGEWWSDRGLFYFTWDELIDFNPVVIFQGVELD